jgi:hypothetical protein
VSSACEKPRSLVIVNTNNLVHVPGNIDQQAKLIQEFLKEKDRDVIAITIATANEAMKRPTDIKVFYPTDERVDIEKGTSVCAVLDAINDSDQWGLEIPVIICGYSQLTRSRSVWSHRRAPTHQVIARGKCIDDGEYCQAFARIFGQSKDILEDNGFGHVEVFAEECDWEMIKSYDTFINELYDGTEGSNEPFHVIWNHMWFSSGSDILRSTNRPLSPNKLHKSIYQRTVSCESGSELRGSEKAIKEKYSKDCQFQRLLRTLLRLNDEKSGAWFDADDVQEAYNRMWTNYPINMNGNKKKGVDGVRNLLNTLADSGKLDKETKKEEGGTNEKPKTKPIYRVKVATISIFRMLLNPEARNEDGSPLSTHWTF